MPSQAMQDAIDALRARRKASASQAPPTLAERRAAFVPGDRLHPLPDDVLVNNAGVGVTARLIDTPLADYDRVMNVNVRGCLLYAQHSYPHLARRSGA